MFKENFWKTNPEFCRNRYQDAFLEILDEFVEHYNAPLWKKFFLKSLPCGLYIHGAIGAGKTKIANYFFDHLKSSKKKREHFHEFMFKFHEELHQQNNQKSPFLDLMMKLSKRTKILYLDEFFIDNIADAMILERFIKEALRLKFSLVFTSNIPPSGLYKNGLHRERFESCIRLIEKEFKVFHLKTEGDWREKETRVSKDFLKKVTYHDLFQKSLGVREYERLANLTEGIEVFDVPFLGIDEKDSLRRLLICVDLFYDQKKIIRFDLKDLEKIYNSSVNFEGMGRMISRLKTMVNKDA